MNDQIDSLGQAIARTRGRSRNAVSSGPSVRSTTLIRRIRVILRGGDEGSTLVEFALILPAFMMLITALCTFAIAFSNELTLTSAVGSGAQQPHILVQRYQRHGQYLLRRSVLFDPGAADYCFRHVSMHASNLRCPVYFGLSAFSKGDRI